MKFSIIIPTLQEETVIEKTLLALKKITQFDYEIMVSDGGSKDKTIEIAQKYADFVLEHKDNRRQTISEGRNIGAEKASGEFLIFLDADVTIPDIDNFLKNILETFSINKKIVSVTTNIRVLKEYETLADKIIFSFMNLKHKIANNYLALGQSSGEIQVILKSAFKKVGGFNQNFSAGEDYDMFNRLSKIGKTYFLDNFYVYHTGRRAHKIGWPKLLWQWTMNSLSMRHKKREWKVIR